MDVIVGMHVDSNRKEIKRRPPWWAGVAVDG